MEHTLLQKAVVEEFETEKQHDCYGLNVYVPPNSYVEAPTPSVMVFGGGAFGR